MKKSLKKKSSESNNIQSKQPVPSFDLDKLARDSLKLPIEVALLISTALSKGLNVPKWLTDFDKNNSYLDINQFCTQYFSLELIVGIKESKEIKLIFEKATSKESIVTIVNLCSKKTNGKDKKVNVSYFLSLCRYKIESEHGLSSTTSTVDEEELPETKDDNIHIEEKHHDIDTCSTNNQQEATLSTEVAVSESVIDQSIDDEVATEVLSLGPPVVDKRKIRGRDQRVINSRDASPTRITRDRRPTSVPPAQSRDRASSTSIDRRRASSVDPNTQQRESTLPTHTPTTTPSLTRRSSVPPQRRRSVSLTRPGDTSLSASTQTLTHTITPHTSPAERLLELETFVKHSLRSLVRQADLYHLLQISLGFINRSYTIIPPRGQVIESKPREWLTPKEILSALLTSRVRLSEVHIVVLVKLLKEFAVLCKASEKLSIETHNNTSTRSGKKKKSTNIKKKCTSKPPTTKHTIAATAAGTSGSTKVSASPTPADVAVVSLDNKINAMWLGRYLTYLRCTKDNSSGGSNTNLNSTTNFTRSTTLSRTHTPATPLPLSSTTLTTTSNATTIPRGSTTTAPTPTTPITHPIQPSPFLAFSTWKQQKDAHSTIYNPQYKLLQFQLLLSGQHITTLTTEEVNSMILQYNIIPLELLQQEIYIRIILWSHNYDGRNDYKHTLNKYIRKYELNNHIKWYSIPINKRILLLSQFKIEIKNLQYINLCENEQKYGSISIEIYNKYNIYCNSILYKDCMIWSVWLNKYIEKRKLVCERYIQLDKQQREQGQGQQGEELEVRINEVGGEGIQ